MPKRKSRNSNKKESRKFDVKIGTRVRITRAEGKPEFNGLEGIVEEITQNGELKGTWGDLILMPSWDKIEVLE